MGRAQLTVLCSELWRFSGYGTLATVKSLKEYNVLSDVKLIEMHNVVVLLVSEVYQVIRMWFFSTRFMCDSSCLCVYKVLFLTPVSLPEMRSCTTPSELACHHPPWCPITIFQTEILSNRIQWILLVLLRLSYRFGCRHKAVRRRILLAVGTRLWGEDGGCSWLEGRCLRFSQSILLVLVASSVLILL